MIETATFRDMKGVRNGSIIKNKIKKRLYLDFI